MNYFEHPDVFWSVLVQLFNGSLVALKLFALTLVLALPLGLLISFMRLSKFKPLSLFARAYIYFFRGTPLLLQLLFFYLGLGIIGIKIDRYLAPIICFAINYAAYFAEIFRGGIQSISRGQYEAASVLGLSSKQTFGKVILPQVVKNVLPPMGNEFVTLVKDTSLIYILGISDLLKEARTAMTRDVSLVPLAVAALFYLIMTSVVTKVMDLVEKRFSYYR